MKKRTHDEYVAKVAAINPDLSVVGEYINHVTKILHVCKIDGYNWITTPKSVLNGANCPLCSGKIKTTDSFKNELFNINPNIKVLGEYFGNKTKIRCMCVIDEYEWYPLPESLLRGHGCPVCAGTKYKTHKEYVDEVAKLNDNIEVVGEYTNAKTKILHKCKIDGCEWMADPHHILNGRGCPSCNISYGEQTIRSILQSKGILFEQQYVFEDCRNVFCLPFDFYLTDYNACVEFDGIQHFQPIDFFGGYDVFQKQKTNDMIKNQYCVNNNILLLRIRYDQNIESALCDFLDEITIQN